MRFELIKGANRGKAQLLTLSLVALRLVVPAQFIFTTNNGTITITGYTGSETQVIIPSTTNGWPVTSIGANAFYYRTNIASVTIPEGVTNIGSGAFYVCTNLGSISVPNTIATI